MDLNTEIFYTTVKSKYIVYCGVLCLHVDIYISSITISFVPFTKDKKEVVWEVIGFI